MAGRWIAEAGAEGRVITVTEDQIGAIRERWVAQWGRGPTQRELQGLIDDAVREEILYREALRLGLDQNDPIVRRRLAQKLTFMLEDNADVPVAAPEDVEKHFATHTDRYRNPRRTTFRHVFLSGDRRLDPAADAADLLDEVRRSGDATWRNLGDPFMLLRGSTRIGGIRRSPNSSGAVSPPRCPMWRWGGGTVRSGPRTVPTWSW